MDTRSAMICDALCQFPGTMTPPSRSWPSETQPISHTPATEVMNIQLTLIDKFYDHQNNSVNRYLIMFHKVTMRSRIYKISMRIEQRPKSAWMFIIVTEPFT